MFYPAVKDYFCTIETNFLNANKSVKTTPVQSPIIMGEIIS